MSTRLIGFALILSIIFLTEKSPDFDKVKALLSSGHSAELLLCDYTTHRISTATIIAPTTPQKPIMLPPFGD
jgi:hypothetical protein